MRLNWMFILLLPIGLAGQKVDAYLTSTEIYPGQVDTLTITISSLEDQVVLPVFKDTISSRVEVFGQSEWDTTMLGNGLSFSKSLFVSSFDTGYIVLPPVQVVVGDSAVSSAPLLFHVVGEQVDLSQNIKGATGIEKFPITWQEVLKYSGYVVGIVLFLIVVYQLFRRFYLNRKSNEEVLSDSVSDRPFMEVFWERYEAVAALISTEHSWSGVVEKQVCSELSDLVRSYLEYRYKIAAMENTTARILQLVKTAIAQVQIEEKVKLVLLFTDQVKFAKGIAMKDDCERLLQQIKSLVEETIVDEVETKTATEN